MEVLRGLIDPCYNAETIIRPGELPVRSSEVLIWHLAAMAPVDLSKEPCLHAAAVSSLHFHDPVQPSSCLGALVRLMGASGPPTSPSWAPTRRLGGVCGVKKLEKLSKQHNMRHLASKHGPKNVPRAGETPNKILQCFTYDTKPELGGV